MTNKKKPNSGSQKPRSTTIPKNISKNANKPQVANQPLASNKQTVSRRPKMNNSPNSCVISHREFIGNVDGTTSFLATPYVLQPAIATTFPWLSQLASRWEQYRFSKLSFEYITRCPATTAGSVILAPDYDVLDPTPVSETVVTGYTGAVEGCAWSSLTCHLDPRGMFPMGPKKFTRTVNIGGSDQKTYDCGNFYICTDGMTGTSMVGKLWVNYSVELYVPQINNPVAPLSKDIAMFKSNALTTLPTAIDTMIELSDIVYNPLGVTNNTTAFVLPKGMYDVNCDCSISDDTAEALYGYVKIMLDGLEIPNSKSSYNQTTAGAGLEKTIHSQAFVPSDGTGYISLVAKAIGAAGNLRAITSKMTIQEI